MGRMIRSKKEWRCAYCKATFIKWQGICTCGKSGTIQEITLIPPKPKASPSQKTIQMRSKRSEQSIARKMTTVDGPEPSLRNIASSIGRVGHITNMRIDAISANYVTENKNRKLPVWLIKAWVLINQRATDFGKNAFLHIDPPNMPRTYLINGTHQKLDTLAIVSETRHETLIKKEKTLSKIEELYMSKDFSKYPHEFYTEISKILKES